jgi:hypothetical protein
VFAVVVLSKTWWKLKVHHFCLFQYDHVIVDPKVVSEFERKLEERARRRNKTVDENEDPDLLRDTPRLILFESEKDSKKKKRGRKKKDGGGSKFSKEFLDAMHQVFGDSDEGEASDDEAEKGEEKKEDEDTVLRNPGVLNKRASESSLFVGDAHDENKEDDDDRDYDEDGIKTRNPTLSDVSRSMRAKPTMLKKPKKKKPKIDPAEVFAEEMKKQDGVKILSTSGLKQEMADMKKGLTRKMMERELANLRKATSNKFSPFDDKNKSTQSKPGRFDDYGSVAKSYGPSSAPAEKKPKAKPINTGLMSHLAKNDDLADNKLDDLATVAHGLGGAGQLPTLPNIPTLNALPGVQQVKAKAKNTLGAISETAAPVLRAAGEQTFFSTQNAWDDDESQANVGLTGTNNSKAGDAPGLTKGQSNRKFKTPQFNFGKRKGSGVQLDDDDEDFRPSDY